MFRMVFLILAALITTPLLTGATSTAPAVQEAGGVIAVQVEAAPVVGGWKADTAIAEFSGGSYYVCTEPDTSKPGTDILEYPFTVTGGGIYQVQVRSRITEGTNNTEANDSFLRLVDNAGVPLTAVANQHVVTGDGWHKCYMNTLGTWTWQVSNKDHNPRAMAYALMAGQTYRVQLSRRSKGHALDRIVLWDLARHAMGDTVTGKVSAQQHAALDALTDSAPITRAQGRVFKALDDFTEHTVGAVPYYRDTQRNALAINAAIVTNRGKFARAQRTFGEASGTYDIVLTTLTEEDGESTYRVLINGVVVGDFTNPRVDKAKDAQPLTHTWKNIAVPANAVLAIESNSHSNGLIPEAGGSAWARGRWRQVELKPVSAAP